MRISRGTLLALWGLALTACHRADGDDAAAAPLTVHTRAIAPGDIAQTLEVVGTLEAQPGLDVKLGPLVPARLSEVLAAEGDQVRKGQVLARLDRVPLADQSVQAQAQLTQAEATRENARKRLERAQQAMAAGVAASQEVEDARLQLESAEAAVRTARAGVSTSGHQLTQAELRAPFDGVVARLYAAPGEQVDPSRPVVEVARVETLELRAPVPAADASLLRRGQAAAVWILGLDREPRATTVRAVAPVLDPQSGAALVRVTVPNPEGALKIGAAARARITIGVHRGVLLAPKSALVAGPSARAVDTIEDGKARRVEVELGFEDADSAEVVHGLSAGDEVILQGAWSIPDGTPLQVAPSADAGVENAPRPARSGHEP
ncbi:MAG: efflux RND transporter periplasmic adaptor subunit [Deltaproteobacteria bacterium]|nr:efflux RND transporter periplasmic adaptor subunit [Deltaproteobacteria bacterium]